MGNGGREGAKGETTGIGGKRIPPPKGLLTGRSGKFIRHHYQSNGHYHAVLTPTRRYLPAPSFDLLIRLPILM